MAIFNWTEVVPFLESTYSKKKVCKSWQTHTHAAKHSTHSVHTNLNPRKLPYTRKRRPGEFRQRNRRPPRPHSCHEKCGDGCGPELGVRCCLQRPASEGPKPETQIFPRSRSLNSVRSLSCRPLFLSKLRFAQNVLSKELKVMVHKVLDQWNVNMCCKQVLVRYYCPLAFASPSRC